MTITRMFIHILLASIYRVPLSTPASMVKDLKARAISLEAPMKDVQIKHPLVCVRLCSCRELVHTNVL